MKFPVHIPFVTALGFELLRFENGEAEIALTPTDEQLNGWSVLHGGVSMTLLDVVMAHAARSPNQPGHTESPGVLTVEMKTTFMRPGVGRLLGRGHLIHRTASMAFCEGTIVNSAGLVIAQATGTFKYVRALPAGAKKHKPLDTSE